MPYTLIDALVKGKGQNQRWSTVDVSNISIQSLLAANRQVILSLEHPQLEGPLSLNLSNNPNLVSNQQLTVSQWLTSNGDTTLPTVADTYKIERNYVNYRAAARAGYKLDIAVPPPTHPSLPTADSNKTDLLITRNDIDYEYMQTHSLVSVNGVLHRSVWSENGLYVIDGTKSARIAKNNDVGIISFSNVGALQQIPITTDMLFKTHVEQKYFNQVCLDVGQSLEGKSVILVLGGYLHVVDPLFSITGEKTITVDTCKLRLIQRIYDMRKSFDHSTLAPFFANLNTGWISQESLQSDELMEAYFTLPQSFIVIVDVPDLITEMNWLEETRINGVLLSEAAATHVLMSKKRRVMDYWTRRSYRGNILTFADNLDTVYQFEQTGWKDIPAFTDDALTVDGHFLSDGYFLKIANESLVPQ